MSKTQKRSDPVHCSRPAPGSHESLHEEVKIPPISVDKMALLRKQGQHLTSRVRSKD